MRVHGKERRQLNRNGKGSRPTLRLCELYVGDLLVMTKARLNFYRLSARRLSRAEDRLILRWAQACGKVSDCLECEDRDDCQHLADKLIGRRTSS